MPHSDSAINLVIQWTYGITFFIRETLSISRCLQIIKFSLSGRRHIKTDSTVTEEMGLIDLKDSGVKAFSCLSAELGSYM